MICVADSFDARNSNRVYRHKLTAENIIDEIESNKGKQFDPEIADIMLKLLREEKYQWNNYICKKRAIAWMRSDLIISDCLFLSYRVVNQQ